jgi:hypothetical protein
MKASDFHFFCQKYIERAGLYSFKAIVSPELASRIRNYVNLHPLGVQFKIFAGEHTFYLLKDSEMNDDRFVSFRHVFQGIFKEEFEFKIRLNEKKEKQLK